MIYCFDYGSCIRGYQCLQRPHLRKLWRLVFQDETGSNKAKEILANWEKFLPLFWQLVPPSEEETPEANADVEDRPVEKLVAQAA